MPLHYTHNGYTFTADAQSLTITPGPKPITLGRSELERLGMAIRDDYQIPLSDEQEEGQLVAGILSALSDALNRCEGQKQAWTRRNLRRAMVLIGGLDEEAVREIVGQEGLRVEAFRSGAPSTTHGNLNCATVHNLGE